MRFGTVALIGRTNVGKSTFLNAVLGEKLAIVSPLPQTTRDEVLGIVHRKDAQIAFTDTPGLHRPKTELGRRMNAKALDTLRSHDVVVFMTDVSRLVRPPRTLRPDHDWIHPDDRRLLQVLRPDVPAILVINKVDQIKDKPKLLPLLAAFAEAHPFKAVMPTSVLKLSGVEQVLDQIALCLPEREGIYAAEDVTDKPAHFFVREYVREQVLLQTHREVPHAVAVSVDRFEDNAKVAVIAATIHVEKEGQRAILVGRGGEKIRSIGTAARLELESLLGKTIHLELFVRITERWKDVPRQLQELGYEASSSRDLSNVLPKTVKRRRQVAKAGSGAAKTHKPRTNPKRPPAANLEKLRAAAEKGDRAGTVAEKTAGSGTEASKRRAQSGTSATDKSSAERGRKRRPKAAGPTAATRPRGRTKNAKGPRTRKTTSRPR